MPYTSEQRVALETEWTEATMAKVGIKFKANAVFKWAEYVQDLGEKLNKSERDKRVKYLAGFPESFDVMIVPERARGAVGNYTHPANYPAHHPNAGNAHPDAGQPDIIATAHAFYIEWSRMVTKGLIKAVPKGYVYSTITDHYDSDRCNDANLDSDSDLDSANVARALVNSRTVCGVCGGIGHAGDVDGVGHCLTSRLSHKVLSSVLTGMSYPGGYSPPHFLHSPHPHPKPPFRHAPRMHRPRDAKREPSPPPHTIEKPGPRHPVRAPATTTPAPRPPRDRGSDSHSSDREEVDVAEP